MSLHYDIDRYRGPCLIVSKHRGRNSPRFIHHGSNVDPVSHRHLRNDFLWPSGVRVTGPASQMHSCKDVVHSPQGMVSFLYEGAGGHRSQNSGGSLHSLGPERGGGLFTAAPPVVLSQIQSQDQTSWYTCSSNKEQQILSHQQTTSTVVEDVERLKLDQLAETLPSAWKERPNETCNECNKNQVSNPAKAFEEDREGSLSPPISSDAISITSDEGSTGTSETVLPRIIKPRKRRKKDRKPPPSLSSMASDASSPTNATPTLPNTIVYGNGFKHDQDCSSKPNVVVLNPQSLLSTKIMENITSSVPSFETAFNKSVYVSNNNNSSCQIQKIRLQCSTPFIFPTPPPSPAASVGSSPPLIEDETAFNSMIWPTGITEDRSPLVRSFSAPQSLKSPLINGLNIPSSPAFNGLPEMDIRLFPPEVAALRPSGQLHSPQFDNPLCSAMSSTSRTRHRSSPLPPSRRYQSVDSLPIKSLGTLAETDLHQNPSSDLHTVHTPLPNERIWISVDDPNNSRPTCIYMVMCYNVLCDKYATRQMYGYCPPWALEWNYRKKGIMVEIRRRAADIITLQEVETDQFFNFFLPELKKDGYDGIFSPKSRAKHMSESERKYVDGCAIFWKTNKFILGKEHLIEFNQLAMANHDGSEDMINRVMTKDNIGLAALLYTTEEAWRVLPDKHQIKQPILVCTAHIHWDPEFCDVKLIQTIMLMSEIRGIVTSILEDSKHRQGPKLELNDIHLLLCGDLNSLPESGVIEFLLKGNVSMDHDDFKGLGYKASLQKIALSKSYNSGLVNTSANIYTHNFRLSGTYGFDIMPFTNFTYEFKGIIDYIFHSKSTMRTLGVLGPIDPEWFRVNKVVGCPHPHIPSDHFPLLVELEMLPNNASHPNGLLHR